MLTCSPQVKVKLQVSVRHVQSLMMTSLRHQTNGVTYLVRGDLVPVVLQTDRQTDRQTDMLKLIKSPAAFSRSQSCYIQHRQRLTGCSSPITMSLAISLASVECPTSSKLSVAFPPACSLSTSSPPGC